MQLDISSRKKATTKFEKYFPRYFGQDKKSHKENSHRKLKQVIFPLGLRLKAKGCNIHMPVATCKVVMNVKQKYCTCNLIA